MKELNEAETTITVKTREFMASLDEKEKELTESISLNICDDFTS
jgi:hypothetical protein